MVKRAVLVVLLLASLTACQGPEPDQAKGPAPPVTSADRYDHHFIKWAKTYFARLVEWEWFKAQAMAESSLRPDAESRVGALGLMQIMPATGEDIAGRIGAEARFLDPAWSIQAGIYYDRQLWGKWTTPRPPMERLRWTFASYNAGFGNILRAQRKAIDCDSLKWSCTVRFLPEVTGSHALETENYVERIERYFLDLTGRTQIVFGLAAGF